MAGINDYSNTAGSNTTINGIDISEGCSPAGINNAIRQLMADIADMDDGVVPLQTPDINGGTIDGAALGASSPITSAVISGDLTVDTDTLYVDTTNDNVGIGTSSPSTSVTLHVDSGTFNNTALFSSTDNACSIYIADSNSGVEIGTTNSGDMVFSVNGNAGTGTSNTEAMRIDSSGNVGIGTSSPSASLTVDNDLTITNSNGNNLVFEGTASTTTGGIDFQNNTASVATIGVSGGSGKITFSSDPSNNLTNSLIVFDVDGSETMRIDSSGNVGINQNSPNFILDIQDGGNTGTSNEDGYGFDDNGQAKWQTSSANQFFLNDSSSSAGTHNYILFRYNGSTIGDIDTLNNSTIRYNTFTGGHWSQFHDGTNPELKRGTVMSLTGDKLEYSKCEKTIIKEDGTEEVQKFEIAGTHEIGSEVTVPNDDYGEEDSTTTATVVSNYTADHLVKVKVSGSVADKGVYGVWAGKYNDGDLSVEALGTSTIRIKQGEVLEVGDLLESAGDGTAQKQTDDTIKNSTIAKVTSPTVIETFDDNSFLVSCVLYCG